MAEGVLVTNTINLIVAIVFTVMGGLVIYLANTGSMTSGPGFQVAFGRQLSRVFERIEAWVDPVPEPLLGLGVLAFAAVFVIATLRDRRRPETDASTHSCQSTSSDPTTTHETKD